jgi:hypothetical protein
MNADYKLLIKKWYSVFFCICLLFFSGCISNSSKTIIVRSPDENVEVSFSLNELGEPLYQVAYKGQLVLDSSRLGFEFKDLPVLSENIEIVASKTSSFSETWEMPWGEDRVVQNNYNELLVQLKEKVHPNRLVNIRFKVYDDGLGFRFEFPEQPGMKEVVIMDENTEFNLTGDHKTWWIPGDWDIYEHLYNTTLFSEIDAIAKRDHPNLAQTTIPENAVNTPVTMKTDQGLYLSFHEANLTNYSGMTLKIDVENLKFTSELVGSPDDSKVKVGTPFQTPWRTVQIAERAGDLIESKLIVNLNEPNKIGDVSWFKPMKYVGIWWEMHLGKSTWDYESSQSMNTVEGVEGELGTATHGATTENAQRYIDFAAANNIGGVLVEGWNTGWDHWIGFEDREGVFDFVTPYPDYDLAGLVAYAKDKGVQIIMHHETSAAPRTYEQQLDTAYKLMEHLGIHSVKTGYVGKIIPKGEYHHGQWMVNHYRKVLEKGAEHQVAINAHEPIKATGIRRTYPNAISREGLRGQEFNAWSAEKGNPPEHLPIVAFTRMLSGPIDFTPGIFNIKLKPYRQNGSQVNTTLAHQLALYVVIYSPIQMAADLIEHYENQPAFQFIRDVAVDWEQSKVLDGEPGDFVVIARQERNSNNWFVGGIADENGKDFNLTFEYLDPDRDYDAVIYADGPNAHWDENPLDISITKSKINAQSKLTLKMQPGGGFAISLISPN